MPRVIDPQDLRQIPLFQLLDDNELAALTDQLEVRKYWKGQMVFWQGSPGDTMFLVHSGRVELYIKDKNGDVVNLNCAEPGDMFGELALLDQQPRSANAKATADTTLLVIDQNDLRQLFQAYPAAAFDIMAMLSRRIREADVLLSERVVARNVNGCPECQRRDGYRTEHQPALGGLLFHDRWGYALRLRQRCLFRSLDCVEYQSDSGAGCL